MAFNKHEDGYAAVWKGKTEKAPVTAAGKKEPWDYCLVISATASCPYSHLCPTLPAVLKGMKAMEMDMRETRVVIPALGASLIITHETLSEFGDRSLQCLLEAPRTHIRVEGSLLSGSKLIFHCKLYETVS